MEMSALVSVEREVLFVDRERVVIMGAAGRDFHNFNVVFRGDPATEVVAFTATQIPGIADRRYPAELAGPLYRGGIPILPEEDLERIVRELDVDSVVFAYSDVSHEHVMHSASRALACGADFRLLGPERTMLRSSKPVIAVVAVRTGCGKSQTTRRVASIVDSLGLRPVVVRHPMPYGDLGAQRVQRFAEYADLDRHQTTIEEREEYEPHLDAGHVVYAGVDYEAILRQAEAEADVVLWDGGNNDFSFFRPDLTIVVTDPLRAGDEIHYHPGETNLRLADVVVVNKIDSANAGQIAAVRSSIATANPRAAVIEARSELTLVGGEISGKRVVVVEDGPTLTHGSMTFGAGIVAARRFGAEIVDPRPHAVGSIARVLERYPRLESLVPAMGYSAEQITELAATLNATPAEVVLAATPIDLTRVLQVDRPIIRVRYELDEASGPSLPDLVAAAVRGFGARQPASI
jgi:predicted GTPase